MSAIEFRVNHPLSVEQFVDVLGRSTLAERRPVHDLECMAGMLAHANLLVTAWEGERVVGVARALTDFHYACYLSDLAVDRDYQQRGIGRRLIALTQNELGAQCKIILLAAPAAVDYYPHIGFERHTSAWILRKGVFKRCL